MWARQTRPTPDTLPTHTSGATAAPPQEPSGTIKAYEQEQPNLKMVLMDKNALHFRAQEDQERNKFMLFWAKGPPPRNDQGVWIKTTQIKIMLMGKNALNIRPKGIKCNLF